MNPIAKLLFICLLIFCVNYSFSQQVEKDSLHFTGKIFDSDSLNSIANVHIKCNDYSGISDKNGNFFLWAKKLDTVYFSHISFKDAIWVIPDSIYDPDQLVGVFMNRDTVFVNEVVIMPRLPDLMSMAMKPTQLENDMRNARNNLNVTAYQAGNIENTSWDAEMNQKYMLDKYKMQATYKGLISPDEMVSFTALIPLAINLINQKYKNDNKEKLKLNTREEDVLISLYKRDKQ